MNPNREIAYRLDPALWVSEILGETPNAWQNRFLRAPRGASIIGLTTRQGGKTTVAAWAKRALATFGRPFGLELYRNGKTVTAKSPPLAPSAPPQAAVLISTA